MIRINVTLTERVLNQLDEEAESLQVGRSETLRRILDSRYRVEAGFASLTPEQQALWRKAKI